MKPQRIRELVSAGMGGDVSGWEPCPERVGDGPARRLPVGDWFTLGRSSEGTVLYYDDGFSMEMAVDSYGPEGTFSGPGCEVVFGAFGGRRTHIEPDREELERFMRLTFYRAPSVLDGGFTFLLSDELALHVTDVAEGAVPRFRCDVSYTSSDGKASVEASGEAVYLPEGPAVVGEGFRLLIPTDLMTLRAFRERNRSMTVDTKGWLKENPFERRPEETSERRREIASALARLRPGSRSMRIPRGIDGGEEPWDDQ